MNNVPFQLSKKIEADPYIARTVAHKKRRLRKKLLLCAAVIFYIALTFGFLSKCGLLEWIGIILLSITVSLLPFGVARRKIKPKILLGKVTKMEEEWKRVPRKGTGAFGSLHRYTEEVRELHILVTDENGNMEVIFLPSQYEKIIQHGDVLLYHSLLDYPAHLSNPTKCICMHCGTMQASENLSCITCHAVIYSLHTIQ